MVVSVALALGGLAAAAIVYARQRCARREPAPPFPGLHRLLSGKYFVDEAYDRLLARPLYWVSDRVFFRLGDQEILDGSLHSPRHTRAAHRGGLSRVQTGNLHMYALFVLVGIIVAIAWSAYRG